MNLNFDEFRNRFANFKSITRFLLVSVSALIYSIALTYFVDYGNLFPGGFSGIARLIVQVGALYDIELNFSIIYFALNCITAFFFGRKLGKKFTLLTIVWFTETSIFTSILPPFQMTGDIVLIAIFGGIIAGFGTSITLNANASSGGTDFIAMYFSNKYGISTWGYVFGFNCCVLVIAGFIFGWDAALYSIVYQFTYTQVLNLLHERYRHLSLMIFTRDPDAVSAQIYSHTTHTLTKFWGEGGFSGQKECLIITTITMDQYEQLVHYIRAADPKSFIIVNKTEKVVGRFISEPLD